MMPQNKPGRVFVLYKIGSEGVKIMPLISCRSMAARSSVSVHEFTYTL
jgi:hypothetical protein